VAFPRLNAFSLWIFVAGAVILNVGLVHQGRRSGGGLVRLRATDLENLHPGYLRRPLDRRTSRCRSVVDRGVVEFITTIINLRAPGQ